MSIFAYFVHAFHPHALPLLLSSPSQHLFPLIANGLFMCVLYVSLSHSSHPMTLSHMLLLQPICYITILFFQSILAPIHDNNNNRKDILLSSISSCSQLKKC
jgi:hypothetical protein